MHWERNGAFTGEISPAMLRELFVRYVVLGHSERRAMFGETDEIVNRKVRAAYEEVLRPILCVGETLEQREKGQVRKSSLVAIARQPRRRGGEGIARNGRSPMNRSGRSARARPPPPGKRRKRTPSSARSCAKCRTRRPRKRSAFNTVAASSRTTRGPSFHSRTSTARWSAGRASIRAVLPKSCRRVCLRNS